MSALQTFRTQLAASFRSMISRKNINVEDGAATVKSKETLNSTVNSLEKALSIRKRKAKIDDDDAVLVDDNSSHGSKKKKDSRYTPLADRKPKIVFHEDPNILEEYK